MLNNLPVIDKPPSLLRLGISSVAWTWLLTGQRLIAIIQSDDPDLEIDKVGGFNPSWNGSEWFNEKRKKNI